MITLSGFGKDYGTFTAVESIDLQIDAGETFGFIGPNGAGKSTTIRFLATLLRASRGGGVVAGHDVMGDPVGCVNRSATCPTTSASTTGCGSGNSSTSSPSPIASTGPVA